MFKRSFRCTFFRCQTCAGWWSKFIRALPPDPLNLVSEGAWHSLGQEANKANKDRKFQKQRIDDAIKAAVALDLHDLVCEEVGCKWLEETVDGVWHVGALPPDKINQTHICGGLICGPFYHGLNCGRPLPICHHCYSIEGIRRPLCECCSRDDGKLPKGYTLCLQDHCPAFGRLHLALQDHRGVWS